MMMGNFDKCGVRELKDGNGFWVIWSVDEKKRRDRTN